MMDDLVLDRLWQMLRRMGNLEREHFKKHRFFVFRAGKHKNRLYKILNCHCGNVHVGSLTTCKGGIYRERHFCIMPMDEDTPIEAQILSLLMFILADERAFLEIANLTEDRYITDISEFTENGVVS